VIPKISHGTGRIYPLIRYLYGPGKHNEHTDQHLIASWNDYAPDPGRNPQHTVAQLAEQLQQPIAALGDNAPKVTYWHCSVRADPGDRHLDDADWAAIARRMVQAVGIAAEGDTTACRWVAVRHADDHIHIAATLVRQDGRRAGLEFDKRKAQAEARRIEKDYGLRQLNPGDGTAAKNPTSKEHFKAERLGRATTARETLREAVRQSLAGAATEAEFFTRLRDAGLRVETRTLPSGDIQGYKVALPGDRNADQQPVWFSGSTLAPDLSLPKIRQRLSSQPATAQPETAGTRSDPSPAARSRRTGTALADTLVLQLADGDDEAGAQLPAVGELLDALAQTSPANTRTEIAAAARSFERATRSHTRAEQQDLRAVRSAARGIIQAGSALGRGEDGGTTAMLLSTLVLLAMATARWHSARGNAQQATAARQTAEHLRTAYHQAATTPMHTMRTQARALPEQQRRIYDTTIHTALANHDLPTSAHGTFDALAATLAQAEQAGHNPETLLQHAIDMRELDTADNIDDVLVWRLRRLADLPAHPGPAPRQQKTTERAKSTTHRPDNRTTPPAPTTTTPPPRRTPRR